VKNLDQTKNLSKMLVFPNCKINLGLSVIEKRTDGFHNIETVFFNTDWRDALEVIKAQSGFEIQESGASIPIKKEDNIVFKAWDLLKSRYSLPPLKVYLHKTIPAGAGLGGGSSDAAFFMSLINCKFGLDIENAELKELASSLGSDCAFFIDNKPVFARGKGDVFETLNVNLDPYFILMVWPGINSNTKEAYEGIIPQKPSRSVKDIIQNEPVDKWKGLLKNDFETGIFKKYPEVGKLKEQMYQNGAVYASMSGSGSSVFGIFKEKPGIKFPDHYQWFLQSPKENELF